MRSTVAHYRTLEKLGEGGMGQVWKAQDTKLDRVVALKILPPDRMGDPDRRRRFTQEAKAISALNHPHIVTIYEIGADDGLDYIAMEFVPGHTLDQLIAGKGLPLPKAIGFAIQIASALARAHARGIIHRDVKPGNVMVNEEGAIKVLDFGLSKLIEPPASGEQGDTATLLDAPRTEEGTLVGTIAYMSPEQAEGAAMDARSDIFSFGALLYEIITGRRAFRGGSKISILAGILREEPPSISSLSADVPLDLEKIVARCLRKDPARRYQHMDDVRIALEDLKRESESGTTSVVRPAPGRKWRWAAAGGAALVAIAAIWLWRWRAEPPPGPAALSRLTFDSGLTTDAALSPDGRLIAYASDRAGEGGLDLWVQQLAGGDPTRITHAPEDEYEPQFAPNGTGLIFRSDAAGGGIYTIPALGGRARLIAPLGRAPRYSPDGSRIAFWEGNPTAGTPWADGAASIWVLSSEGGKPTQLAQNFTAAARPEWTADGKHVVFIGLERGAKLAAIDFWVAPVDGGPSVKTGIMQLVNERHLRRTGRYLFLARGAANRYYTSLALNGAVNLWSVELSPPSWKPEDLQQVTSGTQSELQPSAAGQRIAFTAETASRQVWSVGIDANSGRLQGVPEEVTHGGNSAIPSLSSDGKKLCYVSYRPAGDRAIVRDLATGAETVVADAQLVHHPVISPDGQAVAYGARSKSGMDLMVAPASSGVPEKLCETCGMSLGWSNNGRQVLFKKGAGIGLLDVPGGRQTTLLEHPKLELWQPQISGDGRWVAFVAVQGEDRRAIYVAPYQPGIPPERWIQTVAADAENDKPRWSPDGKTLYYTSTRDGYRCIWMQRLNPSTKRPAGDPLPLLHFHSSARSLSNVTLYDLELSLAGGRLFFVLGDRQGNIWTMPVR